MKENNRKTLEDAIRNLPHHRAPEGIWERIETDLKAEKVKPLRVNPWKMLAAAAVWLTLVGMAGFSAWRGQGVTDPAIADSLMMMHPEKKLLDSAILRDPVEVDFDSLREDLN